MIEFKDVEIRYQSFIAVPNLNLKIEEGEFFTLLGPSGCGKTTTLRALVGFNEVSKGEIYISDKKITKLPVEKRNISIVFQSYALFPTMTVYENIAFGLKVQKKSKEEIDERVRKVAKKVKITDEQLEKNVSQLSGGQQQRVAIARALVLEPKILCLDEPLSNLDAKLRVELREELKRLQKDLKITTIYVTHDQEEALTLSDRIAVFNSGKIEQVGTPYEIYSSSKTEFVCQFIGDINKVKAKDLIESCQELKREYKEEENLYFRLEKINRVRKEMDDIELEAVISDVEYTGMFTKIIYEIDNYYIKSIEKNSDNFIDKIGDKVKIYISKKNIMYFGEKNG